MKNSILRKFAQYVSLNILGMIGLSCYILADTFFVSKALGATGIAALNFSISIYSVIHGIGLMIGIGGATRYSILKAKQEDQKANGVFSTCVKLGIMSGLIFALVGIFGSNYLAKILGADAITLDLTRTYLSTILIFAPFFILNNILLAFVRNDHNPNLCMVAMLTGSFSNIILDYIFMFPLGMGMFGAAFATGLAPIISIGLLSLHVIQKKNNFNYVSYPLRWSMVGDISSLGLSAMINELSSAVVLISFNLVILGLKGNPGVASYGIVANISLVGISIFTGIGQGIQPLVSKGYGEGNQGMLKKVMKYAIITSITIALLIYVTVFSKTSEIVGIFNSEKNPEIALLAKTGIRIYFFGFFFAGINIILSMYLSARSSAKKAFMISIARGCIIIVPLVFLLSRLFGMTGVWISYVLTEGIVWCLSMVMLRKKDV